MSHAPIIHSLSRALCPLCHRKVRVFVHNRRTIFEHHQAVPGMPGLGTVCEATGWLVEDDEVLP